MFGDFHYRRIFCYTLRKYLHSPLYSPIISYIFAHFTYKHRRFTYIFTYFLIFSHFSVHFL
jgi:hypothetical protein